MVFVPHSVCIDSCLLATSMYKFTCVADGVWERWKICVGCGLMEGKKWLGVGFKGARPIFQNLVSKLTFSFEGSALQRCKFKI